MLQAKRIGAHGEDLAIEWLAKRGYALVARNVISRGGELDIIMRRGRHWMFVEVKTRREGNESSAVHDIHPSQVRRLAKQVEWQVVRRGIEDWRLILVCVTLSPRSAKIKYIDLTDSLDFR